MRSTGRGLSAVLPVLLAALPRPACGQLRVDPAFADHMVIQAGMPAAIWGTGQPGQDVTVTLGLESATTQADENGRWRVVMSSRPASHESLDIEVSGRGKRTIRDVVFGEVWMCLGEANMALPLSRSYGGQNFAREADHPELRILALAPNPLPDDRSFSEEEIARLSPDRYLSGKWEICSPTNAPSISATAFHFGDALRTSLDVPIGLIICAVPGAPIESWIPADRQPTHRRQKLAWLDDEYFHPQLRERVEKNLEKTLPANRLARRAWMPRHPYQPGFLAEAFLEKHATCSLRGILWFHGESASNAPDRYYELFRAFDAYVESRWPTGRPTILIVQLPGYGGVSDPFAKNWPAIRDVQRRLAATADTGLIVTIDQGDPARAVSIHKKALAERAAGCALAAVYERQGPAAGPLVRRAAAQSDGSVALTFDFIGAGLAARGDLAGFELVGAEGEFVRAKAEIRDDAVIVSSPQVASPKRVRYAWTPYPTATLFNQAGLPASPFEIEVR